MPEIKFISQSIGEKLRLMRKQRGVKSALQLSMLMNKRYSSSGILRREEGKLKIDTEYIESFSTALKLSKEDSNSLFSSASLDFYRSQRSVLDLTKEYARIAENATTCCKYLFSGLPDELQVPEYTRAIVERYASDGDVDERSKIRVDSIAKRLSLKGKSFDIIIHENSLYFATGTPELMLKQLKYLKDYPLDNPVSFRVLPRELFAPFPIANSFTLYDSEFLLSSAGVGSIKAEDPQVLDEHLKLFETLLENSIPSSSAVPIFDKAIAHYQAMID